MSRDELGRYKKGNIPWNKGTKGVCKPNETSIKRDQHLSPQTEFTSERVKAMWKDPKFREKMRNRPYKKPPLKMILPNLSPTPTLCYIVGALLGDGCVYKSKSKGEYWTYRIQLKTDEEVFVRSVAEALGDIGLNPRFYPDKKRGQWVARAFSKIFGEWYRKLDVSEIRKIVRENEANALAFLRGFYEAEGYLYVPAFRISMYNTNLEILNLIEEIFKERDYHPKIYKVRDGIEEKKWKPYHMLVLNRKEESKRFLTEVGPCIKGVGYYAS